MYKIGFAATVIILLLIAYQDFRFRAVSWILFPLLAVSLMLYTRLGYPALSIQHYFLQAVLKALFISIQLLLLWGYYRLRFPAGSRALTTRLGLGDILFLYMILFYFSPLNFILFYISSLLAAFLAGLVMRGLRPGSPTAKTIPLAGLQSFFFLIFITANIFLLYNPFDDTWLLNLFQPA